MSDKKVLIVEDDEALSLCATASIMRATRSPSRATARPA